MNSRAILIAFAISYGLSGSTSAVAETQSEPKHTNEMGRFFFSPAENEMGRFFFSPAERAQLSEWRKNKPNPISHSTIEIKAEIPTIIPNVEPSTITLKGLITQKNKPTKVWLQDQNKTVTTSPRNRLEPNHTLRLDSDRASLKVGQTYTRSTRSVDEAFHAASKEKTLIIKKSHRDK